jgi:hypothetical protein
VRITGYSPADQQMSHFREKSAETVCSEAIAA